MADDRPPPILVNLRLGGKPDIIYNYDMIDVEAKSLGEPERPVLLPPMR